MTAYKSYDERTAEDFQRLFVERFPDGNPSLLGTFLANPVRRDHPGTGAIAYDSAGTVKAILGLVPRRVFYGSESLLVSNGVAIAVRKTANREFFPDFIRSAVYGDGTVMFFVNTAIPPSRRRAQAVLGVRDGPESCGLIRERELRSNGFLARLLRKVLFRPTRMKAMPYCLAMGELTFTVESAIFPDDFDDFWQRYLKDNKGLVSSRTANELKWMFGKGLESGSTVLFVVRKGGILQGYAFCHRTDDSAVCWRVVDLIALENDERILTALIEGGSRFLRERTPARCLQLTGYPTWVQPLLKQLFPKESTFGFNKCIWVCVDERMSMRIGDWVNAPNGWYGCPYDGDMCLM